MNRVTLTHRDCVQLVRSPEGGRYGSVTIDGMAPIPLACLMLDDGDLLIPTGNDRSLVRAAARRPVSVEFTDRGQDGQLRWSVRGVGLARPLCLVDLPRPLPQRPLVTALPGAFRNGVRVVMARLSGFQLLTDIPIPPPRSDTPTLFVGRLRDESTLDYRS